VTPAERVEVADAPERDRDESRSTASWPASANQSYCDHSGIREAWEYDALS
jgi:hypothetical protein